jgi:hypothetical protein
MSKHQVGLRDEDRGQKTEDRKQMTKETTINKKFLQGGPGGTVFSKRVPPGRRRQRK